ncbi:MAG: hypothetical protein COA43_05180 [Robiginitomaculum sp.]|nr:MAG: hypothetical protein COA43_05180 [Robiginitomaculum sp.]
MSESPQNPHKTNASQTKASPLVEAEAMAWIAQLDGPNASEKDLAAFREWVSRSPIHEQEILALNSLWQDLNMLTDMAEPIRHADSVSKKLRKQKRGQHRIRNAFGTVAMCMSLVLVAFSYNNFNKAPLPEQSISVSMPIIMTSKIGEQKQYTLSDGSVLTLNTNSQVEIDYSKEQRKIRILQGEALFDVYHDTSRPFLVYAGDSVVRAVGTKFSVHLRDIGIEVTVSEGIVELATIPAASPLKPIDKAPIKLAKIGLVRAGQGASFQKSEAIITPLSQMKIDAKLSWQNGLLTFTGETLAEVIHEVSRYTAMEIIIENPEIRKMRFGGVFKSGEIEDLFNVLETSFNIKVIPIDGENKVMLVSAQ